MPACLCCPYRLPPSAAAEELRNLKVVRVRPSGNWIETPRLLPPGPPHLLPLKALDGAREPRQLDGEGAAAEAASKLLFHRCRDSRMNRNMACMPANLISAGSTKVCGTFPTS